MDHVTYLVPRSCWHIPGDPGDPGDPGPPRSSSRANNLGWFHAEKEHVSLVQVQQKKICLAMFIKMVKLEIVGSATYHLPFAMPFRIIPLKKALVYMFFKWYLCARMLHIGWIYPTCFVSMACPTDSFLTHQYFSALYYEYMYICIYMHIYTYIYIYIISIYIIYIYIWQSSFNPTMNVGFISIFEMTLLVAYNCTSILHILNTRTYRYCSLVVTKSKAYDISQYARISPRHHI